MFGRRKTAPSLTASGEAMDDLLGSSPADDPGETDGAAWTAAAAAPAARDAGDLALMPPTWSILLEVAAAPDVETLLRTGADRSVETVAPRVAPDGDGWRFVYEVVA